MWANIDLEQLILRLSSQTVQKTLFNMVCKAECMSTDTTQLNPTQLARKRSVKATLSPTVTASWNVCIKPGDSWSHPIHQVLEMMLVHSDVPPVPPLIIFYMPRGAWIVALAHIELIDDLVSQFNAIY